MSPVPFGRRLRLTSEVGPDASGSNPGLACAHLPDKFGTDLALSLCPRAGVTSAAANVSAQGKFRHCKSIALLLCASHPLDAFAVRLHLVRAYLEGNVVRLG